MSCESTGLRRVHDGPPDISLNLHKSTFQAGKGFFRMMIAPICQTRWRFPYGWSTRPSQADMLSLVGLETRVLNLLDIK
jgi:hypothetical protein